MDEQGPQRLRHLQHHKAADRTLVEKQEQAGPQTVKTDPLISCYCRHLKIGQENIHLVCTLKLFEQMNKRGREQAKS